MIETGTVILGKYKIIDKLGKGGMSTIYLAEDIKLNKKWTVKEIKKKGDSVQDKLNLKSLIDEADLIKKLDHPLIPRIVDIIDTADTVFIVRDYVDGDPMDQIIKNFGAQPEKSVIEWAKIICDIFLYLHGSNPRIVYRDMKPANIMLASDGTLRLIDFGIAQEGTVVNKTCVGTKGFAPPEQFKKDKITDERSDIYSLGMTLYQMVTNINPASAGFDKNVLASQANPKCSVEFAKIIDKCIQDNSEDRYQNCSELLYALNKLSGEGKNGNRKFSGISLLSYVFVALGTLSLIFSISGDSMLPLPEICFTHPIFNCRNLFLIMTVVFYALFARFRHLSSRKDKFGQAGVSIKGDTSQYIIPSVSEGSLFDTIHNPDTYNGLQQEENNEPYISENILEEDDFETGGTQLLGYAPEAEEAAKEEDDFETGGTQLLGYAPEAEDATKEEDDFETGGTQLLGYAPEAEDAAEEEDDFETGGTQLLGYAPEAEDAAEEEDDFETGGTQLLGYAPEAEELAEEEKEDDFETGGTQLLGYAPEAEELAEEEKEDDFETGGTQLLGYAPEAEDAAKEEDDFETGGTQLLGYVPDAEKNETKTEAVEKTSFRSSVAEKVVTAEKNNQMFRILKCEIILASDDFVLQ